MNNCQALCPNCHAKNTRGLLKYKAKSNWWKILKLFIISLIILLVILFFY